MGMSLRAVSSCPRSGGDHAHHFIKGRDACTGCGITRERVAQGGWRTWDQVTGAWIEADTSDVTVTSPISDTEREQER